MPSEPDPLGAVSPVVWGLVGAVVAGSTALVAVLIFHRLTWGRK